MDEKFTGILPLYTFFERLRQNEFPLGTGDYEKLLTALSVKCGIGISEYKIMADTLDQDSDLRQNSSFPRSSLLRICKLLWLKPGQSTRLFEDIFEETYLLDFKGVQHQKEDVINNPANAEGLSPKDDSAGQNKDAARTGLEGTLPGAKNETLAEASGTTDQKKPNAVRISVGKNAPDDFLLQHNDGVEKSKFLFTKNYFPIDVRTIQQSIRTFPSYRQGSNSSEMDVEATTSKIIERGFFNEVIFRKEKKSSSRLILLIDHEGSMIAFDQLSEKIKKEMEAVLLPRKKMTDPSLQTFYFYNMWGNYLYENRTHTRHKYLSKVIASLKNKQAAIVIISDAGAAKGTYHKGRINSTNKLLLELKNCTTKIAWLNPMPAERWKNTSAEEISKAVGMFEADENGVKHAVRLLKGSNVKVLKL